ncbi:transglutaminase-like cysteine peptidase [Xanthobacter dioxanivorans]|uniref:Transglutaminase-like cysteine peptidase n=1 Tax=Xanthobacter dioxanivorans TaxID=2528964 RepID=A0A974PSW5_9HYPH|nr:transglutaminase-like cysteine peptidase [Xanthobacter dioxanivorans]QRG08856.1 transglutaminase-like cysteine peptidase [Xanthobacter dioxanivorans]
MSKQILQRPILSLIAVLLLMAAGASGVGAQETRFANLSPAFAPRHLMDGRATTAPMGFVRFCSQSPHECDVMGNGPLAMRLDAQRNAELERVNRTVNEAIQPETDLDHFGETERWAYPDDGRGDCEDYVLEKRRRLINMGWPSSVLLITVVRDHEGDGHAVLTVITDRGDLILDNQEAEIVSWKDTGYRFVKRQSQASPSAWVSLGETAVPPAVAGTGR